MRCSDQAAKITGEAQLRAGRDSGARQPKRPEPLCRGGRCPYKVQRHAQLLCHMNVAKGGRVGDDCLGCERRGSWVPWVCLRARLVGGGDHLGREGKQREIRGWSLAHLAAVIRQRSGSKTCPFALSTEHVAPLELLFSPCTLATMRGTELLPYLPHFPRRSQRTAYVLGQSSAILYNVLRQNLHKPTVATPLCLPRSPCLSIASMNFEAIKWLGAP
jgi:hypothetical protein